MRKLVSLYHQQYLDCVEEGEGEGGDDEEEGDDGEEMAAGPRPLVTGCNDQLITVSQTDH